MNENLAIAQAAIHRLNFNNTEAVFNDAGNSYDFRVESDTVTHALYVKGSNGNVGISTNNPSHLLEIDGTGADATELFHIKSDGNVGDGGYHWMTSAIAGSQSTNANIINIIGRELASKNSGYFGFHYAGDHSNDNFITIGGYAADQLLNIKMDYILMI